MNRRQLLQAGVPLGIAGAFGAHRLLLPPRRSAVLAPPRELAARLVDGLADEQRAAISFPFDSPWRQYHNRGVWAGGTRIFGSGLSRETRRTLTDLFHAGLSEAGRQRVPNQFFVHWPGVHALAVQLFGDPREGPWQLVLSGPHLNLRLGGASPEGAAFGGPQVWGEQRSDGVPGMPRSIHRNQFVAGQALVAALSPSAREAALLANSPIQTDVVPRGPGGRFPGVPLSELPAEALARARTLIDSVFALWPDSDAAFAWHCLEEHGGLAALCFSIYEEGASQGHFPIFRLEGPGAVIHWRGWPHLHAFCNVTLDGARPLSVGPLVGTNPHPLEGPGVQRLFERALEAELACDLAVYPATSVAGRLRAGPIRSGDLYTLESWQDEALLVDVPRQALVPELRERAPAGAERVTVAAPGYVARNQASMHIGRGSAPRRPRGEQRLVRELLLAHVERAGFPG